MKAPFPIYIINLKRNPERKLFMQRQMDALNLNYQFVDGVDKSDLVSPRYRAQIGNLLGISETNLEYKYSKMVGISKVNPEYGLAGLADLAILLSHIKIYNLILENNDEVACILEDDACLQPTFPTILAEASNYPWDILMFSHHSRTMRRILEKYNGIYRRIIKSYNYVMLIKSHSKISDLHKHINKLLGISDNSHPELSKSIMKILEEFTCQYEKIVALYNPKRSLIWRISSLNTVKSYKDLLHYTMLQLGGLPSRHSHQTINQHHYIDAPAEKPTSCMAYLLKRSAVQKWKSVASDRNAIAIDSIPWHLHTNHQADIRLISPPCVIGVDQYQRYSSHQKYRNM